MQHDALKWCDIFLRTSEVYSESDFHAIVGQKKLSVLTSMIFVSYASILIQARTFICSLNPLGLKMFWIPICAPRHPAQIIDFVYQY